MPLESLAEPLKEIPSPSASADVAWWRALSLEERRTLGAVPSADVDSDLATKRLARRRGKPFDDDALWQRRLDLDGLDLSTLEALLGERDASLAGRAGEEPEWMRRLTELYDGAPARETAGKETARRETPAFPWPEGASVERAPFLPLVEPLVWRAHGEIADAVAALETDLFDPHSVATALALSLPDLLALIINRALVVELHIAKLEERLAGDSPEERFRGFVRELRDPSNALEILGRYPLMARQVSIRIEQWRDASIAFLRDLARDEARLVEELHDGRPLGHLVEARGDVSDPHRDGRGVLLLRFDSGFRAVYKPKSMRVETAFQNLLEWLNGRGFEPALRAVTVVDAGDHGYMEWVESAPCASEEELRRFYRRQGAYLCLLWLLDGTDFHHENLIASGEHPVFVDLETLFQPWVHFRELENVASQPGGALRSSVLRTDLLPTRWWGTEDAAGIDMSGLASREGQMTPQPVAAMTARGTDEMRVERRRVEVPPAENRPRLPGHEVSVLDHAEDLATGFRRLFDLVLEHRDALLADSGPLAAFAGVETRALFRNTATYGTLLLESYHPHLQGNALERDRLFDRLWDATSKRPFLAALIPFERRDMERLDVPLFITRTDSSKAWTWDGEEVPLRFDSTGLERVRRRIQKMDGGERTRQLAAIHDALEALRLSSNALSRPSYRLLERERPATSEELLEKAAEIGESLLERAFETEREALWLAVDHDEPDGWRLRPTGPDVFQGLPGIALFLAYLGEISGQERFTETARRALWALDQQIERDPVLVRGLGSFNGWGGVIHAFTHLGVLWRDEALLRRARELALPLRAEIDDDRLLDLVAGSAGLAVALLELHRHLPDPALLELARACGERLLETAVPRLGGVGWKMPLAGDRALAGMSHGAAGIALALLRLHAVTGDPRYLETARRGFDFERALFDAERGNWPDLRVAPAGADGGGRTGEGESAESTLGGGLDASQGVHEMHAWCHGAPGVGIARLMSLEACAALADEDEIRREIEVAIRTTLESGLGQNHCLCHGDLGNLDFLLLAATRGVAGEDARNQELRERVFRLAGGVLESYDKHGPLFGLPGNLATPGLMTGLAGLGYGFLRLAAPQRVPSILGLEAVPRP